MRAMTTAPAVESPGTEERPRLLAVEAGDWTGLGGNVRLELDASRTVLVGKNGAGKSLLIEGLFQAARTATAPPFSLEPSSPRNFRCEIALPNASTIAYEYRTDPEDPEEDLDISGAEVPPRARIRPWYERCWVPGGAELWKVSNLKLTVKGGAAVPFSPGMGLLAAGDIPEDVPEEVEQMWRMLVSIVRIPAGVPRSEAFYRREVIVRSVRRVGVVGRRWTAQRRERIGVLASSITAMWEHRHELYDEFVAVLRDFGLTQEVTVKIYEDPQDEQRPKERHDFASVLLDGINIGLQSDGTLRVAEIVYHLLQPGVSCLLVEEPETAVHPGLLAKLLSLMDSYSFDRQIVISTHSPQVVDWCEPRQLRLVEREGGATRVHALGDDDIRRVTRYLNDEGTLADFLYARESE
jgi:predicted ATPase